MPQFDVIPILYATLASAFFGAQGVMTMRSLSYTDPQTSSMISMGTCVLVFWLLAPSMLKAEYFSNAGIWIFLINGLFHPLFSMYLAFEAIRRMGATVSSTISSTTPLFASAGAILFLGEHFSVSLLMGTLGTVLGIMVLSMKSQGPTRWALWSLIFPLGAAIIRAANHNLGKFGLEMLPSPYTAALVSFTVSFSGAVLIRRFSVGSHFLKIPRQGLQWSIPAGLSIAAGVFCMYSALQKGLIIVVSPIIASFPLFTFFISLLFRQERLTPRILLGVLFVVGGVIWINLH